jgi:hypothetical protein
MKIFASPSKPELKLKKWYRWYLSKFKPDLLYKKKHSTWIRVCDWRWGNACVMCGSYDNVPMWKKFDAHDYCYNAGVEMEIKKKDIMKFLIPNEFGWTGYKSYEKKNGRTLNK